MADQNFSKPKSGLDLKLRRTAARLKVQDVAGRMGVKPARVSQIEALAVVTDETATRYQQALEELAPSAVA